MAVKAVLPFAADVAKHGLLNAIGLNLPALTVLGTETVGMTAALATGADLPQLAPVSAGRRVLTQSANVLEEAASAIKTRPLTLVEKVDAPGHGVYLAGVPKPKVIPNSKPDYYVGPEGPEATLQSTAYRYMEYQKPDGSINRFAQEAIDTQKARLSYFGFDKLDTGDEVVNAFQVRASKHVTPLDPEPAWSDGRLRLEFDTLQLYSGGKPKVAVPYSHGGKGLELQTFLTPFPQY